MGWWAIAAMVANEALKKQGQEIRDSIIRDNEMLHKKYTKDMERPEYQQLQPGAAGGDSVEMSPDIAPNVDERLRRLRQVEIQRALQGGAPDQPTMPPAGYGDGGFYNG